MSERQSQNLFAVEHRELAAEYRDTDRTITLWHQKASDGRIPHLTDFGFHRLTSDWGYRFLISSDKFLDAAVFVIYGLPFARLLDLPEKPQPGASMLRQLPARYREVFIEGCTEVIVQPEPVRFNGAAVHSVGEIELYRAAFMPLLGPNSSRPLIFGSFNCRSIIQESASDAFRIYDWLGERTRREERPG